MPHGQMPQELYGCKQFVRSVVRKSLTLLRSVELNVGIICSCLPTLPPLGRKLPGRTYFEDQYNSAISLFRESRKKSRGSKAPSQDIQLGSRERHYIELEKAGGVGTESDVRQVGELVPFS